MLARNLPGKVTCRDSDIGVRIGHPTDASNIFLPLMLPDRETLVAMYLDANRRVINAQRIAIGGLDYVTCEPKLVFRPAVLCDASFILIAHNHPSGNPTPSAQDIETTKAIEVCARVLGITFVDHLVLTTSGKYRSIAEYMERGF